MPVYNKVYGYIIKLASILLFLYGVQLKAQKKTIIIEQNQKKQVVQFSDSVQASVYINSVFQQNFKGNYFNATYTLDSLTLDTIKISVKEGQKSKLRYNLTDGEKNISYSSIPKTLNHYENIGYPFSKIILDSLYIDKRKLINISGSIDKGSYIIVDTLRHNANFIKTKVLHYFLNISKGSAYNQSKLSSFKKIINQQPYLRYKNTVATQFYKNKAYPGVNISKRKANQIDGIIGFLPNSTDANSLLITGEFNAKMFNLLKRGINLNGHWEKFDELSQKISASYNHPNILNKNVELQLGIKLLRQDSTFRNVNQRIGFLFKISTFTNFQLGFESFSSRIISVNSVRILNGIPQIVDFRLNKYNLGFQLNTTNDFFIPTKGVHMNMNFSIGQKQIFENLKLDSSYFSTIDLNTLQLNLTTDFKYYLPLASKTILFQNIQIGVVENEAIFLNDMFRIGGYATIRGFNESQYFASEYVLSRLELRQMLDNSSYIFTFIDNAYFSSRLENSNFEDFPVGFGAGMVINTKSGVFNFAYALGRSKDQFVGLNFSKIHFGYVTRF